MILAILAIWWAFYVYHKAISMPLFNFKSKPNCNIQYKFIFDHFLNYADRLRAACHIFPISTYQKVTCQKSANGFVFKNGIVHKCLYRLYRNICTKFIFFFWSFCKIEMHGGRNTWVISTFEKLLPACAWLVLLCTDSTILGQKLTKNPLKIKTILTKKQKYFGIKIPKKI